MKILQNTRRTAQKHGSMPAVLALVLTIMVGCVVASLMTLPIPPDNKDVLVFMAGQLTTAWMISIGYYFQSTAGSKAKDALLADSVQVQRSNDDTDQS